MSTRQCDLFPMSYYTTAITRPCFPFQESLLEGFNIYLSHRIIDRFLLKLNLKIILLKPVLLARAFG